MVGMQAYAKFQSMLAASLGPLGEQVTLRPDCLGVPLLILAVPEVEVVMMVAECKEILGTYLLIQPYKIVGIPLLGFEKWKDVLLPTGVRSWPHDAYIHWNPLYTLTGPSSRPNPQHTEAPNGPIFRTLRHGTIQALHIATMIPT